MPGWNWVRDCRVRMAAMDSLQHYTSARPLFRPESPAAALSATATTRTHSTSRAHAAPRTHARAGPHPRRRHVGQGLALRPGAFLHLLVMFQTEGFTFLLGFQRTHAIAIFVALLPRHQFGTVNTILVLQPGTILIARLVCRMCRHDASHVKGKGKGKGHY